MNKILIARQLNYLPTEDINQQITDLGEGWKVSSATTETTVFGIGGHEQNELCPIHHCWYVITVVMEKI